MHSFCLQRVAIKKCCNLEVTQKIVFVNKETGFSVVMLHNPTFPDFKEDRAEVN